MDDTPVVLLVAERDDGTRAPVAARDEHALPVVAVAGNGRAA